MKAVLVLPLLFVAQASYAVPFFEPARCAHDQLSQGDQPVPNSARGRNAWYKVCKPDSYETSFPDGNEMDPFAHTQITYPTYGLITGKDAKGQTTFSPTGFRAPTVAPTTEADPSCVIPAPNKFVGLCTAGCVAPSSEVETVNGRISILEMSQSAEQNEVLVPTVTSAGAVALEKHPVRNYTKDIFDAHQTVYVIRTVSGGEVYASNNHPFLSGSHKMVRAKDFKVGDALITADGRKDLITSIVTQPYFGKLYNLTVETNDREKSTYVVQGYISGDKKIQAESISEFNRGILRDLATEDIN